MSTEPTLPVSPNAAIGQLCTSLASLFNPEQRDQLFLQPHRHVVLALKQASWQPDQSRAAFMFYLYENMPDIVRCGAIAIDWLIELLPTIPEYKLAETFAVIQALYHSNETPAPVRARIEALQAQKVYRHPCFGQSVAVALHYFLQNAEERPNFCGDAPDYLGEDKAPMVPPHASCIIRPAELGPHASLSPTRATTQVGRYVRQAIDRFAHLVLRVEPWHDQTAIRFTNHVETFTLHPEFTPTIISAIYQEAIQRGVNDQPLVGMQITLIGAIEHPIDTRPDAIRAATVLALRAAFAEIL